MLLEIISEEKNAVVYKQVAFNISSIHSQNLKINDSLKCFFLENFL